jgi:hypothetical protein
MCGRNATKPLFPIKTLKVEAGSTIGFGAMGQSGSYEEDKDTRAVSRPMRELMSSYQGVKIQI